MKNALLSIESFKQFQLNEINQVKGGASSGATIVGSSQAPNGSSYVDIDWNNGTEPDCDVPFELGPGQSDGANDTVLGTYG